MCFGFAHTHQLRGHYIFQKNTILLHMSTEELPEDITDLGGGPLQKMPLQLMTVCT